MLFIGTAGLLAIGVGASRADEQNEHPHFFARHFLKKEGTPPPGKPRSFPHTDERAGYPRWLSGHLETSRTAGGIGYYVGGGVPCGRGDGRRAIDGTWGWDDTGCVHLRGRTILGWSQGRRYQGGSGAYRTDGPVMPDLIYTAASTINSLGRKSDSE
jgi:hypothetical protein